MKKLFVLCALLITITAKKTYAQDGYQVLIDLVPQKVEILPGAYELYGIIKNSGENAGKECYALSVNESLVTEVMDSVKAGKAQILFGPKFEKLIQKKIIDDYNQKRTEIEKKISDELASATGTTDKKKISEKLKLENKNSKEYIKRLTSITERYAARCIYVYSRGNYVSDEPLLAPEPPNQR